MKILIIGGAGLVGRSLLPYLPSHEVSVLDTADGAALDVAAYHRGSALDDALVRRAVEECEAVVHLATVVPRGPDDQVAAKVQAAFDVNVRSVYTALLTAQAAGVKSFVHASSMSVYAQYGSIPIDPLSAPDSLTPYGLTKRLGEQTCAAFASANSGMTITSLRLAVPTTEEIWPQWRSPGSSDAAPVTPTMGDGRPILALHPSDLAASIEWALIRRGGYAIIPVAGDAQGDSFLSPRGWQPRMRHDPAAHSVRGDSSK